jgi:hypothetical protein
VLGPVAPKFTSVVGVDTNGTVFSELLAKDSKGEITFRLRVYDNGTSQIFSAGTLHIHSGGQLQLSSTRELHWNHPHQRATQVQRPSPVVYLQPDRRSVLESIEGLV